MNGISLVNRGGNLAKKVLDCLEMFINMQLRKDDCL